MKRIKPSRIISLLFCLTLLLGNLSVMGIAAEPDEMPAEESVNTVSVNTAPVLELPDNPELFAAFVESELYSYDIAVFGTAARASLNPIGQKIYDALKSKIETVALNGGSTVFMLSEIDGLKTTWTNTELGVASIEDVTIVEAAFTSQFDLNAIVTALLNDCPFDLYWYDKTFGVGMDYQIGRSGYHDGSSVVWNSASVEHLSFTFTVAVDYMSGQDAVTTDVSKILIAKNNAAQVVAANAAKTDYEKLLAYKDYICQQVSYNYSAAENSGTPYGDPWQMISVFDADASTNVVCEGYSKAFMYLCDLSSFTDDTACYTVTGQMDGGNHMWNIVTLDEENYLVDVTNSDDGAVGQYGGLFLAGGTGSVTEGYSVNGINYTYDNLTLTQWGTDAESILRLAAGNYAFIIASGTCGDNLTWTLDVEGLLTISGEGEMQYDPWRESYCDAIQSVEIENGVTQIDAGAFNGCNNLIRITIPESVTSIGSGAFYGCHNLTKVLVPMGVTKIDDSTFYDCSSLTSIDIPDSVTSIGDRAFYNCSSLTSIDIPEGVTCIDDWTFYGCSSLTSISIPDGVTSIGSCAFFDCSSLLEIVFPVGLVHIGDFAFEGCTSLVKIDVPNSVESLGQYAFRFCINVEEVIIGKGIDSISEGTFINCQKVSEVVIPEGITTIENSAFCGWSALKEIDIPSTVKSIGECAFYSCICLEYVEIPGSVERISEGAFAFCDRLREVVIESGVTSIEKDAFLCCQDLLAVSIPVSVKYIRKDAFSQCARLWHILYAGTESEWYEIEIEGYEWQHSILNGAVRHYGVNDYAVKISENTCSVNAECAICAGKVSYLKQDHDYQKIVTEPTCTEQGFTTHTCHCGDSYVDSYVDALGHDMGDWVTTKEPSTTEEGEKERTCKREGCSHKETEKIPVPEKALWQVSFANMSLSNSLAMNFAFAQSNEADWTGYYAVITKTYADGRPDAEVKIPAAQWGTAKINGVAHYTISFKGIAVKEMGDEIHVRIYNSEGKAVSSVWTDTARDYALRAYKAANATQKEKRMLIDMLNYGAAAQQMFKYDKEHLVTAGLTDEQKAMATQQVEAISNLEKGANYLGTNLTLESEIRMNVAFKNVTEGMYAKVSLTNHAGRVINETAQMDIQGSTGVVRVNQIAVADGRTMVTITVYNADGSIHGSVVDSLEGYIFRASNNEPEVAQLYEKILMFADSTYNFKH